MTSAFWHPFANMARTTRRRVVFVRGEGTSLFDRDGRRYFDATACLWYCAVGHGRREIAEAIARQASTLAACSSFDVYTSDVTLELADRLAAMAPIDDARVFLTSGGSDGIETAAKIARRHFARQGEPQREIVLSRVHAYHGTHGFGTSLAGIPGNRDGWGSLVGAIEQVDAFDADALAARIDALGAERVAAFVVEPVIGAGGVYPPPAGYLQRVADICRARGVLLIADEVITGVGRLGTAFACEHYGIRPDMVNLAKILTSGYQPLGAVLVAPHVAQPYWEGEGDMLRHGYTYSGHATACAAAHANLDVLEREGLFARAAALGEALPGLLAPLEALDGVAEIRTAGLLAAVQLDTAHWAQRGVTLDAFVDGCRERGVLTRALASGALQLSPPFVAETAELERFVDVVADCVEALDASTVAA